MPPKKAPLPEEIEGVIAALEKIQNWGIEVVRNTAQKRIDELLRQAEKEEYAIPADILRRIEDIKAKIGQNSGQDATVAENIVSEDDPTAISSALNPKNSFSRGGRSAPKKND